MSDAPPSQSSAPPGGAQRNEAEAKCPVGGLVLAAGDIEINAGLATVTLTVRNTADRPVQIGSHFHFFEVNSLLSFDRAKAFGMRLDIPATTAVRFEPGDEKQVTLIPYTGARRVVGFNGLVNGWTGNDKDSACPPNLAQALHKAKLHAFKDEFLGAKTVA